MVFKVMQGLSSTVLFFGETSDNGKTHQGTRQSRQVATGDLLGFYAGYTT